MTKSLVTLGGVALAANRGFAWRIQPGVAPYQATVQVHKSMWQKLEQKIGEPLQLIIKNSSGDTEKFEDVYILHKAPSDSLYRVTFVISDKRWKWGYQLIVRDYNIQRKTGSRTNLGNVPIEAEAVVDKYDYLPHTINQTTNQKWKAKEVVEDVLELLEPKVDRGRGRKPDYQWEVESWPLPDADQGDETGTLSVRNLQLRDQGDVAVARALELVPGADIYIRQDGTICVFDTTDMQGVKQYKERLPVPQHDGEVPEWIDRKAIRPSKINVYYARELELMFEFEDNWTDTVVNPDRNAPFLENVIPTTDRSTRITIWDAETGNTSTTDVAAGTWVRIDQWLYAMDQVRPANSPYPWTWETVRLCWFNQSLDQAWGGAAQDVVEFTADVQARIDAFKSHFRRTFRINPRYARRFEAIKPVRAATLDPVTGTRLPAGVWGQALHVPSTKGNAARGDAGRRLGEAFNVDWIRDTSDKDLLGDVPMPAVVGMREEDLGVFEVTFLDHPYGLTQSWSMGLMERGDQQGQPAVLGRDLEFQEEIAVGYGMAMESAANTVALSKRMKMRVVLTVIPNAPNSKLQFHKKTLTASDIDPMFQKELGIASGDGPEMDVFITPSEATARYQLTDPSAAKDILEKLLGLGENGEGYDPEAAAQQGGGRPQQGGNQEPPKELPGWLLVNEERHLDQHAKAVAATVMMAFADSLQGLLVTNIPNRIRGSADNTKFLGNLSEVTYRIGGYPSGKVDVTHGFPGQQRPISRLALFPSAARRYLLQQIPD